MQLMFMLDNRFTYNVQSNHSNILSEMLHPFFDETCLLTDTDGILLFHVQTCLL